ncbi:hypothetical protein SDC9_143104 [bioreactor metagenome]|uniref:Uncharacterized protein n=1 Tax=bioreactor metagenome TaxID=1076179 RepID=A0A645E3H0_9ZZZZ
MRRGGFHGAIARRVERLVVHRHSDGVNDPAEQFFTDRNLDHAAGSVDTLANVHTILTVEQNRADAVQLQVHGHAVDVIVKGDLLAISRMRKTLYAHDAVANVGDDAVFVDGGFVFEGSKPALERRADILCGAVERF